MTYNQNQIQEVIMEHIYILHKNRIMNEILIIKTERNPCLNTDIIVRISKKQ